jgi:hypothetical protein
MPILNLILILVLVGVVLWLVNTYGAQYMDAKIVKILNVVVVVVVILWVVSLLFGGFGSISAIRVGR